MEDTPLLHPSTPSLRYRLRQDLASDHAKLDAAFAPLDLRQAADFKVFLGAQRLAFAAIDPGPAGAGNRVDAALIDRLVSALDRDLDRLGATLPAPLRRLAVMPGLALDYVVLGSRLGTQMLRRQWQTSKDPAVLAADAYMALPPMTEAWRGFCDRAGRLPADGADAARAVQQSRALFDLFGAAQTLMTTSRRDTSPMTARLAGTA